MRRMGWFAEKWEKLKAQLGEGGGGEDAAVEDVGEGTSSLTSLFTYAIIIDKTRVVVVP